MTAPALPPDLHVHTEWSWDAVNGDMVVSCQRAVELGLPAIAFSEHADFTPWTHSDETPKAGLRITTKESGELDAVGYLSAIDHCRERFPQLRILSSVELGEPHLFVAETEEILNTHQPDRVLGSVHCIEIDGMLVDISSAGTLTPEHAAERFSQHLKATLELVNSGAPFEVLAHIDYGRRYWPHDVLPLDGTNFEDEYRSVLRSLANSGRVLEVNTWRGGSAPQAPSPPLQVLRWWYEEGGEAVSFGSDAHSPETIAAAFRQATEIASAAGFRPSDDPIDYWGR